jgi:carbon monoxide dehydrogenase subunit G
MNIEGTYTLQAPPRIVWQRLKDKELLQRAFPGLVRFEPAGDDAYEIALQVTSSPLSGTYYGLAHVTEHMEPHSYHVMITPSSDNAQNTLSGNGGVQISERDGNTIIAYKGSLTLSKRGTRLSPTMIKGAAKLLLQQFFTGLAEQLRLQDVPPATRAAYTLQIDDVAEATVVKQPGGNIVILPQVTAESQQQERSSILRTLVRLCHLGEGDPAEEERWAGRIRRAGVISGFVVLVLLGMRLARKR